MKTLDAVYRIQQERWPRGTDGKRKSKESLLSAHLVDDDDNDDVKCISELVANTFSLF